MYRYRNYTEWREALRVFCTRNSNMRLKHIGNRSRCTSKVEWVIGHTVVREAYYEWDGREGLAPAMPRPTVEAVGAEIRAAKDAALERLFPGINEEVAS